MTFGSIQVRRLVIGLLGTFLAVLVLAALYFHVERYTIVLTQAEIQQRLEVKFPIKEGFANALEVEFSHPVISLDPIVDRIIATIDAVASTTRGIVHQGTVTVSGSLRYEPKTASLYLDDARVLSIDIDGISRLVNGGMRGACSAFLGHMLQRVPIYVIRTDTVKKAFARMVLRDVRVTSGTLVITLGF